MLAPYTSPFPRALVPVGGGHAVIDVVLRQLRSRGFVQVTLVVGHLGALVEAYCGDGSQWGLHIDYVAEDGSLGPVGPVASHLGELADHFLVIDGDALSDIDFGSFLDDHVRSGAAVSLVTTTRSVALDVGVVDLGEDGATITAFRDRPVQHLTVSTGTYAMSGDAVRRVRPAGPLRFEELVRELVRRGERARAVPFRGLWLDMGDPDDQRRASEEWEHLAGRLLPRLDAEPWPG